MECSIKNNINVFHIVRYTCKVRKNMYSSFVYIALYGMETIKEFIKDNIESKQELEDLVQHGCVS